MTLTSRARLSRLAALARWATDAVGALLFLGVFLCFVVQVFARYVLNHPQAWTDELAVVLFVVLACWSASLMTSWREHVTLDVLIAALPDAASRMLRSAGLLATAVLFVIALPATWDLVLYMTRKYTPVLDLNQALLGGSFLLLLVAFAVRAAIGVATGAKDPS